LYGNLANNEENMPVALLTFHCFIPGCSSLKEKRGKIKPLLFRLHREFNVSTAEMEFNDKKGEAVIACVMISNDFKHLQKSLQQIIAYAISHYPDIEFVDENIDYL
jgi:hypothetical protein